MLYFPFRARTPICPLFQPPFSCANVRGHLHRINIQHQRVLRLNLEAKVTETARINNTLRLSIILQPSLYTCFHRLFRDPFHRILWYINVLTLLRLPASGQQTILPQPSLTKNLCVISLRISHCISRLPPQAIQP